MGVDDGWMPVLRIGHFLSMIVAVICVFLRNSSINNDDAMMGSHTPVEQYFIVRH